MRYGDGLVFIVLLCTMNGRVRQYDIIDIVIVLAIIAADGIEPLWRYKASFLDLIPDIWQTTRQTPRQTRWR